jgi:hypothetical protein
MNKRIVLFALLVLITAFGYAQKFVLSSVWRDSAIVIDGSPVDWDQPFPYFDSKSKLQYSVVNDDKYIFISVKTNDPKAQMKIMRAGMDVWLDVTGKKKEIATIHCPLKTNSKLDITNDPNEIDQQVIEKPDVRKMALDWAESNKEVHTQGFKNVPADFSAADSAKHSIEVAINWERDNTMTYELKVPFSAFFKEAIVASDTLKPITIGIKAYAMDLPLIPTNASTNTDINSVAGNTGMNNTTNGMPNTMNNNARPQTSSPQPSMAIPKSVADMGLSLIVTMKIKLAFR